MTERNKKGQFVKGCVSLMTGKKHTKETLKKMSDNWRQTHSITQKMIEALKLGRHKGKKHSGETKRRIGLVQIGHTINEKQRLALMKGREKHTKLVQNKEYWTNQRREVMRNARLMAKFEDTKPERKLREFLDYWGIDHISKYPVDYYVIDEYLPKLNLCVETDGLYWHNYPEGRWQDKRKDGYLKKKGYQVMRLWETEVENLDYDLFINSLLREGVNI